MTKRDKVTVDDVIGIVHTDEPTNSVDEVRKLRGRTNERFELVDIGFVYDNDKLIGMKEIVDLLNQLNDENKQLKKELESFKPIIFESDGKPVTLYKKGDVE